MAAPPQQVLAMYPPPIMSSAHMLVPQGPQMYAPHGPQILPVQAPPVAQALPVSPDPHPDAQDPSKDPSQSKRTPITTAHIPLLKMPKKHLVQIVEHIEPRLDPTIVGPLDHVSVAPSPASSATPSSKISMCRSTTSCTIDLKQRPIA